MVRLYADAEHAALAHRIPATRDISNLRRGQDQILIAHDLRHSGRDFRDDSSLDLL